MSAVAETSFDALSGDRLAKRNALVLAVGQALAGGNNTVIVATASILGSMMAPDDSEDCESHQYRCRYDANGAEGERKPHRLRDPNHKRYRHQVTQAQRK